jgi:hypothetical protein
MALVLLLMAGGLAVGVVVWQAATSTTSGTIGGGNVFTSANNVADCSAQARAFADYPVVWAGPSVLGYPLVHCDHSMTKTRYDEQGRVSSPGDDSWAFAYGTCTPAKGRENCPVPITIITDPCALTIDGRIIPKASQPVRSITVRGAKADISGFGVLTFEQEPQMIQIYAPEGGTPDERAANAVLIAEALIPANALADALSRGAPLTTAFAAAPDTLCRNSFVPAAPATAAAAAAAMPPPSFFVAVDLDGDCATVNDTVSVRMSAGGTAQTIGVCVGGPFPAPGMATLGYDLGFGAHVTPGGSAWTINGAYYLGDSGAASCAVNNTSAPDASLGCNLPGATAGVTGGPGLAASFPATICKTADGPASQEALAFGPSFDLADANGNSYEPVALQNASISCLTAP